MITAYGYASAGNEHFVLAPTLTAAGEVVARTLDDAFDGITVWPGNLYELRIDPRDVMDQGAHVLRVRRYDVVRVVPQERLFGSNVAKLDAFVADLGGFDWLRPSSEDRRPRAAVLVAEHYAALAHHDKRVRVGSCRIIRDIDKVEPLITSPYPVVAPEGIASRSKAHTVAVRAVDQRINPPRKAALVRIVGGIVISRAWRAAWKHVAAAHLEYVVKAFRAEDGDILLDDLSSTLLELAVEALDVAMDPGLHELMAMPGGALGRLPVKRQPIDATVAVALAQIPSEWGELKERFGEIIAGVVRRVWFYAWRFATHATTHSGFHALHLASALRHPDPWAPWVGLFRLGLWPLADDGLDMTVYDPPVNDE